MSLNWKKQKSHPPPRLFICIAFNTINSSDIQNRAIVSTLTNIATTTVDIVKQNEK